jgi:hypothetical protein
MSLKRFNDRLELVLDTRKKLCKAVDGICLKVSTRFFGPVECGAETLPVNERVRCIKLMVRIGRPVFGFGVSIMLQKLK